MKTILFFCIFLLGGLTIFSQSSVGVDNGTNQLYNNIEKMRTGRHQLTTTFVRNPPRKIFGSYHIFNDWNNQGVIYTDDKAYKINNININIRDNRYEASAGRDSVYTFDSYNINKIKINNRNFKNFRLNGNDAGVICEVIAEDDALTIIRLFSTDIKKNEPDPLMLKPDGDEYVVNSQYYIKNGEGFRKFKLNKKNLLKQFGDKGKDISEYAKEQKLSFKNPEDVKKIISKWKEL